jgi:hypothetical protein
MGSNHVVGKPQTEFINKNNSIKRTERAFESQLENRIENLETLVNSIQGVVARESFSDKRHAIDFVADLRMKTKSCREIFRIGRLLREPARESMLLKLSENLDALEEVFASRLGVKMN